MARAIALTAPVRDPRLELAEKLQKAPIEHAEALLETLELLQELHDRQILATARGVVAAGDKVVEHAVGAADTPESVAALRNAIILGKMFAGIDPCIMRSIAGAVTDTMSSATEVDEPPSLFSLLGQFRRKELRRSISFINRFLAALGTHLRSVPNQRKSTAGAWDRSGLQPSSNR